MRHAGRPTLLLLAGALTLPALAAAVTLQVANTGLDGPSCGAAPPCRSITQAITNAVAGDAVVVGPGFYSSDLDNDSIFNEPGEEPAGLIVIDKAVTLTSALGASSTVVEKGFWIQASGVVLGRLSEGFTISTTGNEVLIGGSTQLVDVRVGGNVIVLDDPGGPGGILAANTRGRIEHNRIIALRGCPIGIFLAISGDVVTRNSVIGCNTGFFSQDSNGVRFIRNTAVGNSFAIPNGIGFDVRFDVAEFSGNVAIGNGSGVQIDRPIPIFRNNTFAGNTTNCGLRNFSGTSVNAARNWWGAATGPGADPADDVCNFGGSTTITAPVLTADPTQGQAALR